MTKKTVKNNRLVANRRIAPARMPIRKDTAGQTSSTTESLPRWTFLTNHSHVLILLSRNPTMVLREVAALVGITERAVQRIVADLEDECFIERDKVGRQNHYRVLANKSLRHPIESHREVADLLRAIDGVK